MSDEPNIEALLDKGFGIPPAADADNSEQQPESPADNVVETPATDEPAAQTAEEEIWTRALFSQKMHEVGAQRRLIEEERAALAREREKLAPYAEIDETLSADERRRARFQQAWEASGDDGQGASPAAPVYDPRIDSMAAQLKVQKEFFEKQVRAHHDATFQGASVRVAKNYGLSPAEFEAVKNAAFESGLLVPYQTPPEMIETILDMAAAKSVVPRLKAQGQRELLDQIKDKGRATTPATERPAPPETEPDVTKMSNSQFEKYLIGLAEKAGRGTT